MKLLAKFFKFGFLASAIALFASPLGFAIAQELPKIPDWKPSTNSAPNAPKETNPPLPNVPIQSYDQSDELVVIDKALAEYIAVNGPKIGYGGYISDQGVLYDAAGGSPEGQAAVETRFGAFPANIIMQRRPEKAMASGNAGASWGGYAIMRGETILSDGRYVTIWRKEPTGWKIVSELAAGRTNAPPQMPTKPSTPTAQPLVPAPGVGALPKMRDAMGRPIGTRTTPTNPN